MKKIVLLVDFTRVCQLAMEHVAIITDKCNCHVTLLHIAQAGMEGDEREIHNRIKAFAKPLETQGIAYSTTIDYGNFFDTISESINKLQADLVIVGTHLIRGNRQDFVRSNIIKLIQLIDIPSLIVQEYSVTPPKGYSKIIVPLLDKPERVDVTKPIIDLSKVFGSIVHYVAFHYGTNEAQAIAHAKELASEVAKAGINIELESEKTFPGAQFAKSIVEYTDIEEAQIIGLVMSHHGSSEYFSLEDQENILLNRLGKAVLCF